jgi:hypothetical protein
MEAKYILICLTSKQTVWLSHLFDQIGVPHNIPTPFFCGNQGTIQLIHNPEFHCRTKHVEVAYHYVQDQHASHHINMQYIHTSEQSVDLFAKALSRDRLQLLCSYIGLGPPPSAPA